MNLIDIFLEKGQNSKVGIVFIEGAQKEQFLSYKDLKDSALQVLSSLQSKGLKPKNELVFQVDDNKSFVIIFWACILGGIVPVPLAMSRNDDHKKKFFQVWSLLNNPSLITSQGNLKQLEQFGEKDELTDLVAQIGRKSFVIDEVFSSTENGDVYKPNSSDIAFIQFSSGSTGSPKGIILTHENLIANIEGITSAARYSDNDTMISWMPLTHDMGMIGFHLNPLFLGINQYIMPTTLFIRNPRLWLDKISEHKISITCSPNFGYRYLLKNLKDSSYNWNLSSLRIIYNGAEPISEKLCTEFNEKLSTYSLNDRAICPVYGLAEASVAVCISGLDDTVQSVTINRHKLGLEDQIEEIESSSNGISLVSVGKPINYCSVKITGQQGQDLDDNWIGHIRIKGKNVTSGYYNNYTSFKEIIDRDGWLDTGDLGFIRDGALYIVGRAKDIIFVNGQNFYSHDIEKEGESLEGIELNKIVVSGSLSAETQTEEVIAFLFHREALQNLVPIAVSLKEWVNERFGFEIHKILPVRDIPRTTSGKLQRYELVNRYKKGEYQQVEKEFNNLLEVFNESRIVPPANTVESEILNIWQEIFHNNNFGVEKSFFHIGGDSLKAAELIMKLQHHFHVELPFEALYRFNTVRKLAAEISNFKHKEFDQIPKTGESYSYAVPPSQRRMYYAWKVNPGSIAYNIPNVIKLEGEVDFERLGHCLRKLVQRHDSLRMTFYLEEEPRVQVCENISVNFTYVKFSESDFYEILRESVRPFDLNTGPLFKFILFQDKSNGEYLLFTDFHHIISDGKSAFLFIEELLQLYIGNELGQLNTSFKDYGVWEDKQRNTVDEATKDYWKDQFSDHLPVLELPFDYSRPIVQTNKGKRLRFILDVGISSKLKEISKRQNVSNHTLLFTIYNILLLKYSGQDDIIIGIPSQGRKHPDAQQMQGMFVNNFPIRNRTLAVDKFTDLLKRSSKIIHESIEHQDWTYDDLVSFLKLPSNTGRNPLFDTMFLYQNCKSKDPKAYNIKDRKYFFDSGTSKFDISLEIFEENDLFRYEFEYSTDLFRDGTIVTLSMGFVNLVKEIIENPESKIENLSPLSKPEFDDFVYRYNETSTFLSVINLFEEHVKSKPSNIALEFEGKYFTYEELHTKALRVANALISKSVKKGDLVGIHLKRSPDMVAAILGILKAGAAYLPLENEMPLERVMFILKDSHCQLLISELNPQDLKLENESPLKVWGFKSLVEGAEGKKFSTYTTETDLAYVIYTSGTTGNPKGVMINHENLTNYITWASDMYIDSEDCSFALYSSISFDLTCTSIFTPLATGNKIVLYGEDYTELVIERVIKDNKVDVVKLTPSHLKILRDNKLLSPKTKIRKFIVGGEALESQIAKDIFDSTEEKIEIFNEYGPTEATVGCMIYKFDPVDVSKTVPIGKPIWNTQIYLLDKNLKPVPVNVWGNLYIGGKGLAKGYLYKEELTEAKFVNNPFMLGKMYQSGDLGRRLPNGNIEYIGRNDKQVKINGNRVELSEIEVQLTQYPNIQEAVVLVGLKNSNTTIAYLKLIVPQESLSDKLLRDYLADRLPYFMIPKEFIEVAAIPLTINGKVDTGKLQAIQTSDKNDEKKRASNEIEKTFVKVWEHVLNVSEIGITDNFFEHGGDSIKAVQISSRLFQEGILVKVKDILTHHTIESISRYAEVSRPMDQYEQGIVEGEFAPTPIQSWFFENKFKQPNFYNQSALFEVNSPLDIQILGRTFDELIKHHDTLRVNYDPGKGTFFYNNNHLKEEISIKEYSISEGQTLSAICNEIRSSFDISKSLLINVAILKEEDGTEFLFVTLHHLIMDGISWRILLEDFFKMYSAISEGSPTNFPPKTASFKDWSTLINGDYTRKEFEWESDYWNEMEQSVLATSQELASNNLSIKDTTTVGVSLNSEMTEFLLKGAHKSYNTDVPIILNTALLMTLNVATGLDEFVIEQENHGRHLESLNTSRTIGWFTTTYLVKLMYKNEIRGLIMSVKEVLRKVPINGIGYGINKYLSNDGEIPLAFPAIKLNYLGQFGQEMSNSLLSLSNLITGNESHPENAFTPKLECNSWVVEGKFTTHMIGSLELFRASTLNEFADSFIENLNTILSYLKEEDNLHFTPSDFSAVNLEEAEIHDLFEN